MKKFVSILFALVIFNSVTTNAQGMSSYLEHHWYGWYTETSTTFVGDQYTMYYEMYDVVYDNTYNTFTATMYGSIKIDDVNYATTWKINGKMDGDYNVQLNYSYKLSADELPQGLYWIYDNLSGKLYTDSNHSGEYLISGYKPGTDGKFELSTYK